MTHEEERIWLIKKLQAENPVYRKIPVPADESGQKDLLRILMNVRMPGPIGKEFLSIQDAYLRKESMLKGVVELRSLQPCSSDERLYIWQGDITRLRVDAIVNAANSAMLGCFQPLHACIDNAIHSAAGLQLREECDSIMRKQGHEEPTGQAKITSGYNLPAKHVLHTVGPIVQWSLTENDKRLLESCYRSCLKLADEHSLESIAFCCISTGIFGFPKEPAAEIAVNTVRKHLDGGSGIKQVVFNVFKDEDLNIYRSLLNAEKTASDKGAGMEN